MSILGSLLLILAQVLNFALSVYVWVIIITAILSWFTISPYHPIVRFLRAVTDPVLNPVRSLIGRRLGPIDISPLLVILAIIMIRRFLIGSLIELAYKLKGGMI